MKIPEQDEERPLAWTAVLANTPVFARGEEIGGIEEVLGAEDIFHGIVVRHGPLADPVMIPADSVAGITNRRIDVSLTPDEVRALPPFQEEETFKLGMVGFLRKHLGWVPEGDNHQ